MDYKNFKVTVVDSLKILRKIKEFCRTQNFPVFKTELGMRITRTALDIRN